MSKYKELNINARILKPLLFLTQYYTPDMSGVAQIIGQLTMYLSTHQNLSVHVLTSKALSTTTNKVTDLQTIPNLKVTRIPTWSVGKKSFLHRLVEYTSFYLGAYWYLRIFGSKFSLVVSLSTPPLITSVAAFGLWGKKTPLIAYVQDLYPELLFDLGIIQNPWLIRQLSMVSKLTFRRVASVIAIGRCMEQKLYIHYGKRIKQLQIISNWAVTGTFNPPNLSVPPTLLYTGNMGLGHDFGLLKPLIQTLKNRSDLSWIFVGGGKALPQIQNLFTQLKENRVKFFPFLPTQEFEISIQKARICLVVQSDQSLGDMVPSKLFGYLASGRPVLFIGPRQSEVAIVIKELKAGVVLETEDDLPTVLEYLEMCFAGGQSYQDLCISIATQYQQHFGLESSTQAFMGVVNSLLAPALLNSLKDQDYG